MRYPKEQKSETHERILHKAGARFRAEGVDSVGVASLMQSVGLTAGGFYSHFESKEDLVIKACTDGFSSTLAQLRQKMQSAPKGQHVASLVALYLSASHRDHPDSGCFVAAIGAEIARHPRDTRRAFTAQVASWIVLIEDAMRADGYQSDARGIAATMVGTMVLARSVEDPQLSDAFLESGRNIVFAALGAMR